MRRRNVVGTSVGHRHRKGRYHRDELAVIVTVAEKLGEDELRRRRIAPLPGEIVVQQGRKKVKVPIDVRGAGGAMQGHFHGLVATRLQIDDPEDVTRGAVGAVVQTAAGERILTAGHVAPREGRAVEFVDGGAGQVEAVFRNNRLDHSIVLPTAPLPQGAATLPDGLPIAGVRAIDDTLLGQPVHFHHAADGMRETTVVRELHRSVDFGKQRIEDLIVTDYETLDGDSGTLLFDDNYLAVGTLVGWFGPEAGRKSERVSVFLPCDSCFARIQVSLETGG